MRQDRVIAIFSFNHSKILNINKRSIEGKGLVAQLVFKTNDGRIKPRVAGSIPALSAICQ